MSSRSQVCGLKIQVSIPVKKKAEQTTHPKENKTKKGMAMHIGYLCFLAIFDINS